MGVRVGAYQCGTQGVQALLVPPAFCLAHLPCPLPPCPPLFVFLSFFPRRYDMRDVLAIESAWLTELAPHMYRLVPLNPQMRR